jgi:uracil-DNA glycosylase family protein
VPTDDQPKKRPRKRKTEEGTAADLIPPNATLDQLRKIAAKCKACHLWRNATQTVFGEGPPHAKIMLVGEQPGDREDKLGHPFVGPAGAILDSALEKAGINRSNVYLTNVVKHFKWISRGKRRVHEKPRASEINACKPWLLVEIARIKPRVIVCLGATAAQALLGSDFRVSRQRGELVPSELAPNVLATVHPSSLLRIEDKEERHREIEHFVNDLKKAAQMLK